MIALRALRRLATTSRSPSAVTFRAKTTKRELGTFPGTQMPLSGEMEFRDPIHDALMTCFRVVNEEGEIVAGAQDPELGQDLMLRLYSGMVQLNTMDQLLYDAQRQGRISFYLTALGEEAVQFGSASALPIQDMVFGQYREPGVLMWRGYSIQEFVDQCYCNVDGHTLGRQTPMHYGSKKLNFHTISSPFATQLPHAVGAAYGFKIAKRTASPPRSSAMEPRVKATRTRHSTLLRRKTAPCTSSAATTATRSARPQANSIAATASPPAESRTGSRVCVWTATMSWRCTSRRGRRASGSVNTIDRFCWKP